MDNFTQYEEQRNAGRTAREVYLAANADGVDEITAIRMLRNVFGLSLNEAKRATMDADPFELPQTVKIGGVVYWEGSDSIEGSWVMQAKVKEIRDGFAYVFEHRKFLVKQDELEEVGATGALLRIPLKYFERSLIQRMNQSATFWKQLAEMSPTPAN